MKRILILAIITAFFIVPSVSFAQCVVITDGDLGAIFAKDGSVSTTLTDITIKNTPLLYVFTDGWNYWDPRHCYEPSPHMKNQPWFFYGTPDINPQKHAGCGTFDQGGYFGYGGYVTGGLVERSGVITIISPDLMVSSAASAVRLTIDLNSLSINAHIGINLESKIGTSPDPAKAETMMHWYIGNLSIQNISGSVTIYAHN